MRITQQISIVGSGRLGFMLTGALDCNVYLVDCGGELLLVDAGGGRDIAAILEHVRTDGYDLAAIRHVLLTHAHADHAGGCAEMWRRLGLKVWASAEAGRFVREGDEPAISLAEARAAGIYPPDYLFSACPVDGTVEDDVPLRFGDLEVVPLATPGHAAGHMAYTLRDVERACLFSGDLLLCGGQVLLQHTYDCSLQRLGASLLRLADLRIDGLFPGHLHFCLRDGQAHVERALADLRRLRIPPSVA